MRLVKTKHYQDYHEAECPIEIVAEVIHTTKGRRIGKDLIEFVRRSPRRGVYVLCGNKPGSDVYRVINAKIWRR